VTSLPSTPPVDGVPVTIVEAPTPHATRSPADVLRLVVATVVLVLLLLVEWLFGDTLTSFFTELLSGLGALPRWIVDTVVVVSRVLACVFLVGGLSVALRRGRVRMLATVAVAGALAAAVAALLDTLVPTSGATVVDVGGFAGPLTARGFPSAAGLAAVAAVVTAAAPWLSRRWRRLGWLLVVGLALTRFLASEISFDSLQAVLVGWFVGALVLVVLGGPPRRPRGRAISEGLGSVGVPLVKLEQASLDARGSTPYFAVRADGGDLFVKALGQDERSADLLFRVYRRVTPRELGDERMFSSLRRAVEHEALVALAARDVGVRTPRLVAFTTAEPNGFVLAYEAVAGRSLDRLEPAEVTDEILTAIWRQVGLLRAHRIAHRDLRLANIFLAADGQVWMIDFGFSELAASDLLLTNDVAELLASSTLQVGPERAIMQAQLALGPDELRAALGRLHPWALSGATRTGLKGRVGLLDDLRARVAAVAMSPRR
jgi:glycosyltransferase 2 family protein